MHSRTLVPALASLLVMAALTSCASDDAADTDQADSTTVDFTDEYWSTQRSFIDSVINAAPNVAEVAKSKGSIYVVADDTLAALVRIEARKTEDCYTKVGRGYDPHLTGVATILVNFGAAGWDLVRVEDHQFSSAAGGAVVSCINARAKSEWDLPTKGVKPGAHLVQLTFRPDEGSATSKQY